MVDEKINRFIWMATIFVSSTLELVGVIFIVVGGSCFYFGHERSSMYALAGLVLLLITNGIYYKLLKDRKELSEMAYGIRGWISRITKF